MRAVEAQETRDLDGGAKATDELSTKTKGHTMSTSIKIPSIALLFAALLLLTGLTACEEQGPAEQLGEQIDEGIQKSGEEVEQLGEDIQNSAE